METTTKVRTPSAKQIAARWGPKYYVREDRDAPSAAERDQLLATIRELRAAEETATKAIGELNWKADELVEAARFALDVDGDEPSWSQLIAAVERAEQHRLLSQQYRDAVDSRKRLSPQTTRTRYTLLRKVRFYDVRVASADTLEQLAAIEPQAA